MQTIGEQIAGYRKPENDPETMDHFRESMTIHMWQQLTPMIIEGLAQLTLGGPMHVYHGGLQHARFRYFDPEGRRPGLPAGVAALVDGLRDDGASLTLVNTDVATARDVIVQAGTFGEHAFAGGTLDGVAFAAEGRWLTVRLEAGATARLELSMRRYVTPPSYDTPWMKAAEGVAPIVGREL